jgi:hypothetical protein
MGLSGLGDFEGGDYAGITFLDTYFVRTDHVDSEPLHFHELVHVLQWQHLGLDGFISAYAAGLAGHGYRNSPLEVMAYKLQTYFESGQPPRDVTSYVRQQLDHIYPRS